MYVYICICIYICIYIDIYKTENAINNISLKVVV